MFLTREILQPRPDTSYACWNCCSKPVRSCSPSWYLVGMYDLCSEPVRSCSPTWYRVSMFDLVFRTREILQRRPDTLKACWICGSEPVRSCSPVLLLRRRVRSGVQNPLDPAARSGYLVSIYNLMFLTREILQPLPDSFYACTIWCSEPMRSCSPVRIPCRHVWSCALSPWDHATPSWHLRGTFDLVFRTHEIPKSPPDA